MTRDEAIAILEEGTQLDSDALPQQVVLLVELLSSMVPMEVVGHRLDTIGLAYPHRIPEIHERLADEIAGCLDEGRTEHAELLAVLLVSRTDSNPDLSFLAERAVGLRQMVSESGRCNEIAAQMKTYFDSHPPAWWSTSDPEIATAQRETLIAALQHLDQTGQAQDFVRISVEVITRFHVAPDFFGFLIFRCADHLDAAQCDPELRDRFLDWCEQLPDTNRFRFAAATLRRSIEDQGTDPQCASPQEGGGP